LQIWGQLAPAAVVQIGALKTWSGANDGAGMVNSRTDIDGQKFRLSPRRIADVVCAPPGF
jgi:hypothetical protein